jgi:CHAT domain-containing protein
LLVTPAGTAAYKSPVKRVDLNRKVMEFRKVLESPQSDPKPLAQELYHLVIPPSLAEDLRGAGAETLMWELDGALRYLPLAALHDGNAYLIETYRLAVFTPASNANLTQAPQTSWKIAGFGVTQSHEVKDSRGESIHFEALPGVEREMKALIAEEGKSNGVMPGELMLDAAFTESAMRTALRRGDPVIHIASHFQFEPGDNSNSFLLLGDGTSLSLKEIDTNLNQFTKVDLLTLSACNTGLGDNGDGREVESFGVLAQQKGAGAVVASLWSVSDESTSRLMEQFYRLRQENPGMLKAEALRQAQLYLLKGVPLGGQPSGERGVRLPDSFGPQAPHDYSHPYFWAPFFLMGNWL